MNDSANSIVFSTTATAGDTVYLAGNNTGAVGGMGNFSIGTFTADDATQTIVFNTGCSAGAIQGKDQRGAGTAEKQRVAPHTVPCSACGRRVKREEAATLGRWVARRWICDEC
jgi:hypothetical protein